MVQLVRCIRHISLTVPLRATIGFAANEEWSKEDTKVQREILNQVDCVAGNSFQSYLWNLLHC